MKKIIFAAILLTNTQFCMADGWAGLSGKDKRGGLLDVYPAYADDNSRDYSIEENRELFRFSYYKGGRANGKPKQFKETRCKFKKNKAFERIEFSCEKSGDSPLSGVRYKIVPNKNPDDCSYQTMFICTRGCDNPAVPQKLFQGYWECPGGAR